MATELYVLLDTTDDPPVKMIPKHQSIHGGKDTLKWTPLGKAPFTFAAFSPLTKPFSNVVVTPQEITAGFEDKVVGHDNEYVITVKTKDGATYTSKPTRITGGGGGNATIKNN
jgi:hypothetical protein